ncbi:hypothetical protein CHCC20335_4136 [Bacillus paralicheniformis]|nr:hypothetical protein CHCC20335_4136 [Bacillus paralicheniformis]
MSNGISFSSRSLFSCKRFHYCFLERKDAGPFLLDVLFTGYLARSSVHTVRQP